MYFSGLIRKPTDVSIDALVENKFMLPALQEFRELDENDRKRSGLKSNLTMAQGQRYNDGKNGKFNINREVLPYDQTRVKLKTPINGIDYINASWIQRITESNPYEDVYKFLPAAKINFLLTQDPTPDTQEHFYQMMYEQHVDIIVHVGSDKSLQQWNKEAYGKVSKELIECIQLNEYMTREKFDIYVKHNKSTINHPITAYHFTAWPTTDQFSDIESKKFLTMISIIRRDIGKPTKQFTIASHDSFGGVEGASSFLLLFQMVQELETKLKVRKLELGNISRQREIEYMNVFEKVDDARKHRAHMISTFSNYKFLFSTLAYYAKNKSMFDTILTKFEKKSNEKPMSSDFSKPSENLTNHEIEYATIYSDEIEDAHNVYANDELIQDVSNNDTYYNDDIYVN